MANNQQLLLGEGAGGGIPNYIEEVFSTYLYTGTGAALTITNNIDLSTKGGLVWLKRRSGAANHQLYDTVRGVGNKLASNETTAQASEPLGLTAFNSTGFSLGSDGNANGSGSTNASWTFREQPKFFDVVTYTGTGSNTTIAHTLGAVPGCIIVKRTDTTAAWAVYHRSLANTEYLVLNSTAAKATGATRWNSTTPTSTVFSIGTDASVNASGGTYVAYLFAHDAGGFGLAGTDNVISCGTFTTDASGNAIVNLGYEPQWILIKQTSEAYGGLTGNWSIQDSMRGLGAPYLAAPWLYANTSDSEVQNYFRVAINATGFTGANYDADTPFIYIAIRRGPMKVPTVGTSVYSGIARTGTGTTDTITAVGFAPDFIQSKKRSTTSFGDWALSDRLRGDLTLFTSLTNGESVTSRITEFGMDGVSITSSQYVNNSGDTYINYFFRRAPGFFDEVCYTGTGSATTQAHNLGVAPEMIIVKKRSGATYWPVRYSSAASSGYGMYLNDTGVEQNTVSVWTTTAPTSAVFSIGASGDSNASAATYVAYLFATCAGVSKVGSYTGNGSSQTIACGFTAGSRFVMIKRTDDTGDWYVWDSARGIIAGNDPHLSLNTTAAEVTTDDSVDTDNSGFIVNQLAATDVNVSSATYIFLAIA